LEKRNSVVIEEPITTPYQITYRPKNEISNATAYLNFPAVRNRKAEVDLNGACLKEYTKITSYINKINKNRMTGADQKLKVSITPLRLSPQSKPIKNTFAVYIKNPDGSETCFFHLNGKYHISMITPEFF
jgi:hypothetical protein